MRNTALKVRSLIASVLTMGAVTGAFAAQAGGQQLSPARIEQDLEFVEKLQGYYLDLAEEFLGKLEKSAGLRDQDKARIGLVRASILSARAAELQDLNKKVETYQQSIAVIEDFLKKYPSHPSAAAARARIGEIGREMGDAIIEVIRDETDSKKVEALRNQAEKTFKDAEDFFRKEIEKLSNPKNEDEERSLAIARFNYPKTQYRHALLFEKGNPTRNFLLKDALKNLNEALFEMGNPELPATYDAFITKGLALRESGDWKGAREAFREATNFKDLFEDPDNQGKYFWQDPGPYIVASAFLEICLGGNEASDFVSVIDAAAECLRILPDIRDNPLGWRIMLEKAKALHQTGQTEAAQKEIDLVIAKDPKGYWGRIARDLVTKLLVDPESAAPSQLVTAARAEFSKNRPARGLDFLKAAIRKAMEKADKKTAADAFYLMAAFFDSQGKDEEAVLAYLQIPAIDPKHANAPDSIYRAASNLTQLSGSGSAFYDNLYQKAVADLRSKFPDSKEAKKAELFAARRLYAKKQWQEAAKIYESVPETSENYVEAVIWSGQCYYMQGRELVRQAKSEPAKVAFEKAVAISRKAYEKAAKLAQTSQKEDEQSGYRETAFASLTRISEIYLEDAVGKPADALKNLEGLEKTYTDAAKTSKILSLRLQALIDLNRLDDAAATLDTLLKSGSTEKGLSSACRGIAARLEKDAEEREKKSKGDPRIASNLRRAASYYLQWIEKGKATGELRRGPEDYLVAADRLVAIGEKVNETGPFTTVLDFEDKKIGEPVYWQNAAGLYETALKPPLRDSLGQNIYQVRIKYARALAALKQWPKVTEALETLVKAENMVNPVSNRLNANVVNQKPALLDAYALLGFAYYLGGRDKRDNKILEEATEVFARVQENSAPDSVLWWQVRFLIVNVLFDQGEYQSAFTVLSSILNNYPEWDAGKFGMKPRFEKLKSKVDARVPNALTPPAPPPEKPKAEKPKTEEKKDH